MRLQNISLAVKLWTLVIGITLALVAVGFASQRHAGQVNQRVSERLARATEMISLVIEWRARGQINTEGVLAVAMSDDDRVADFFNQRVKEGRRLSSQLQERLVAAAVSEREKVVLKEIAGKREVVLQQVTAALASRGAKDRSAEDIVKNRLLPALAEFEQAQQKLLDIQTAEQSVARAEAEQALGQATLFGRTGFALVGALGLLCTWLLLRSILNPLHRVVNAAERIAGGDLFQIEATARQDEVGRLLQATRAMSTRLNEMVIEVRDGVEQVATAASEIAAGNLDLSRRTEGTALSLQAAVTSVEGITQTILRSVDYTQVAGELADRAKASATRCGEAVDEVVGRMDEVSDASQEIAAITSVIDSLAFQTNILALNAAVEAARAGEQGRGFAVVAQEVRSLAHRSAAAARDIRALIAKSTETVDAGSRQVRVARGLMECVVSEVLEMNVQIGHMNATAGEQREDIRLIHAEVDRIDQMTQQNAALVEQAAAAANSLRDQSSRLAQTVAIFRTSA